MKKSFISLFLLTLILSHFSNLNLWAGVAQDTWIDGNPSYANQFKWYSLPAVSLPNEVVNIQQPNFDASNWGIYVSFGDADFNQIYYNGILKTNETDYKIQGAGISFRISSLTAQNTVILIKKDGNTKYGLRIYNSAVTINAAGTELLYSYADGQYTTTSGSETSCAGTLSSTDKIITGSDFYWSGKHSETVQKYDNTWTGVASNVKCCSRDELTFSASTYKISIVTKNTEGTTRKLPKVQINSVDYSVQRVIVGGESQSFSSNQWTYAGNTETTLEYDIDYSSSGSGPYHVSMVTDADGSGGDKDKYLFKSLTISSAAPACTAPSSVTITGTNKYLAGQTISLTATPSGGSGTATYQWQKEINSVWTNINNGSGVSGATENNLQITSCDHNNSGQYRCVVSTGASCSTNSGAYGVHVFSIHGAYYGGEYSDHEIVWSSGTTGTATIHLNASSTYMFKVWSNDGYYYGNGDGNYIIQPVNWNCGTDNSEMRLFTGPEGDYTFTVDIENAFDNGTYVNVQVAYPSVTHPVTGYVYLTKWWDCYPHCWDVSNNYLTPDGYDPQITTYTRICGTDYWYMPALDNYTNVYFKNNPTWTSANEHGDETTISGNSGKYYTHNGTSWDWHSFTTYTISFAAGDGSGSMSSITGICPSADQAITVNSFTAPTGYEFSHWTANVDVTINSATVTAGSAISDGATLQSIGSNITLTAHWSPITYTITLDKGDHGAANKSATVAYDATSLTSFTAVTATGYNCTGYYDGSTKVLDDEGAFANTSVTGYITSSKWSKADNCTLTAKWTPKTTTITIDANTTYHGSTTPETVMATWGQALPAFTAASGASGYGLVGYYTGANDGTKIINADGTLVQNVTGYTSNNATPVWIYETSTLTLYPHYDPVYTVTVNVNNGSYGSAEANKASCFAGATVTITAAANIGYLFDEWTTSDAVSFASSTSAITTFIMPSSNVTVQANFDVNPCTNIYTIDCGSTADYVVPTSGTRVPSTQSNEAGIYTNYYTGYHGEGYYDFKKATSSEIYYAVHLPAAQYTFEVYTATDKYGQYINVYRRTDGESGDISYGGYYYTKMISQPNSYNNNLAFGVGQTISEQNLDEEDYIIGLYSNGDFAAYDQVVITANSDVFCEETSTTYDVTITGSPAAGQASATGAGSYEEGETVTINATPNRGYSFNTWSADPSVSFSSAATTASNSFSMPASDVALTASYNTLTSRTVTVNNDGNGSGSADLNPAYVGETVTLTATPNTGYRFVEWTTSDGVSFASSTSASTTFTMLDKNVTVQANFALVDNVIASGHANTLTGSWHDEQGSTLSGENVDADCVFDHNVFKFTYTGFDGSGKYYGMDIIKDAGYNSALSDGATGIGFYYMTEAANDGLAFCLDPKGSGGDKQHKMQLAATNGVWTYVYVAHSEADEWDGTFRFWINSNDNATVGDAATTTQQASGHFYIANISATAVTSKPTISKYAVTVSSNNDSYGTASGAGNFFDCESVTVTASKNNESYTFDGWYQGETRKSTELSYTFTMNDLRGESSSVALQARFSVSGYVVNYEVMEGNGTITSVKDGNGNDISNGEAVASGTVLTFTAAPAEGYAVLGWYTYLNSTETLQGNTQNSNTFNYEVTGDITIRVKFDTPYTLTLNSSPAAASATVSGGGSYVQGTVVSVSTSNENGDYTFVHWMDDESEVISTSAVSDYVMPASNKTLNAVYRQSRISSLSWSGSEDLGSGMEIASSCFDGGCFDSKITFTFTGDGTVNYYANNDHETPLGRITSGTAIALNDTLRTRGIYIKCTEGVDTLTAVSKTTVGSVYEIWSAARSKLGAVAVGSWSEQVVLGPEHFQTAMVGDVLRVNTSDEGGGAQGALQYIDTEGAEPTYKGLDDYTDGGLHNWDLTSGEKDLHYFERTIDATRLANLKRHGVIVKGSNYTIQSVELRASCSNQTMRTTAPDIITYGDDGSIDIMTDKLDFGDEGFDLGNWEQKLELHENCFTSVTVGSVINFYMSVKGDATLSFRCNVDSVYAKSYGTPPLCPSYGDISFDRTIDDLYGDAPAVVGTTEDYKVLYLLVDEDMRRRLQETGMILCGKGTLIKVVEGVEDTVTVMPNDNKPVPTVVNNIVIYQGGQVTNKEDIMVLGSITYIRPAKDDGTAGKLGNKLDQWYTFALPFTVSDVEVLDTDGKWYDINAVYYSNDATDQATNKPDGAGHYYLQYLKAENETAIGKAFAARWQYITPGHGERIFAYGEDRYGYPKKDSAYIILFDREHPIGPYFETNTQVRFVGVGPQTIDGVAKVWTVEADGEQYWMYANNTLHSFTLPDAYILNDAGTEFVLQESPTIRPFECYVQATASLKKKYAAIPMRGFHIDNTTTGAESIQGSAIRAEKILRNGQLIIIRNGVEYDATGVVIR